MSRSRHTHTVSEIEHWDQDLIGEGFREGDIVIHRDHPKKTIGIIGRIIENTNAFDKHPWNYEVEWGEHPPGFAIKMVDIKPTAQPRQLKAKWSTTSLDDVVVFRGIDIKSKL